MQQVEGSTEAGHAHTGWGQSDPDRGPSQCQGPESGACLGYMRNSSEASMAVAEGGRTAMAQRARDEAEVCVGVRREITQSTCRFFLNIQLTRPNEFLGDASASQASPGSVTEKTLGCTPDLLNQSLCVCITYMQHTHNIYVTHMYIAQCNTCI